MAKKSKTKKKHTKRRRTKKLNPKDVTISNCDLNPDPLELSKRHGDEVLWRSGDGGIYAVVFYPDPPAYPYGSPFHDDAFIVKPTGATPSGPIRHDAEYADYKYRVVGNNGCHVDPIIRIGP